MAAKSNESRGRIELIRPTLSIKEFAPTSEQQAIIESKAPRLIVYGGPGSGKSRTLIESVVSQIKN